MNRELEKIAVVGAGTWGTALALTAAQEGRSVTLWVRSPGEAEVVRQTRHGIKSPMGRPLPPNVSVTHDWKDVAGADLALVVVPSVAMRSVASQLATIGLPPHVPVVSCTKGIERDTHLRMSQILKASLPNPIGVLSGPNHAEDIFEGRPSATLVGFENLELADAVQRRLATSSFRIYSSTDLVSMELGGAIKNVFAIGAGICEGLGLGDNAKAALVTRGLAEMTRIGLANGGKAETFMGLSGMGDLIVTCFSKNSRNLRVGLAIAAGKSPEQAEADVGMVVEGIPNTLSTYQIARKGNVRTPIVDVMHDILYLGKSPIEALNELMDRGLRAERIEDN